MRKHAAFFDVDETLINIKSMFDFYDFWCRENNQNDRLLRYMSRFRTDVKNGVPRETLNRDYVWESIPRLPDMQLKKTGTLFKSLLR